MFSADTPSKPFTVSSAHCNNFLNTLFLLPNIKFVTIFISLVLPHCANYFTLTSFPFIFNTILRHIISILNFTVCISLHLFLLYYYISENSFIICRHISIFFAFFFLLCRLFIIFLSCHIKLNIT